MTERPFALGLVGLDRPNTTLEGMFRFAAEQGLDAVDLYNRVNLVEFDLAAVPKLVREYGVRVNSVSSRAMPNSRLLDPEGEVALALESLEQAARLGAPYSESMVGAMNPDVSADTAIEAYLDRMGPALRRAERLGVTIVVENVFNRDEGVDVTATLDGTIRLMEAAGGSLGLCWDTGNYIVDGSEAHTPAETVDAVLPWVSFIQFKDVAPFEEDPSLERQRLMRDTCNGVWQARPFGTGRADLARVALELQRNDWRGTIALEMFTSTDEHFDGYWNASMAWMDREGLR